MVVSLLSVRVDEDVQESLNLVQDFYEINSSELVRMAPLLLALVAEGYFKDRREHFKKIAADHSLTPKMLNILKKDVLNIRGGGFVEYIKNEAKNLRDKEEQLAISDKDIELDKNNNLPRYKLFTNLKDIATDTLFKNECKPVIEETLAAIGQDIDASEPWDDSPTTRHDPILLSKAGHKFGYLDERQKEMLREEFKRALLSSRTENKSPLEKKLMEEAADEVIHNMKSMGLESLDDRFIPPRYDGMLLYLARIKLDVKRLTPQQKVQVRDLLKNRF